MTLPDERYRAVADTKEFLTKLAFPGSGYKRIPLPIRETARHLLRHYPSSYDLDQIERAAPHVLQRQMEPLYKMMKQHEMAQSVTEDYRAAGMIADDGHEGSTID